MPRRPRPSRPLVRPWALAGPILVMLVLAPLLQPLRAPGRASPPERVTLEAVRAVLRTGSLALDPKRLLPADPVLRRADGATFAQDPPVFDVGLAGVGWLIERCGVSADANPVLFPYLLIFFACALPTAVAGALLYRVARWFELRRPWRFSLALACVLASGWASQATGLRPHAPATALVVACVACLAQFTQARRAGRAVGWLMVGGFCGAAAAAVQPLAGWAVLALLAATVLAEVPVRWRVIGVLLAVAGAAGPATLHGITNRPITGDLLPPRWHVRPLPGMSPASNTTSGLTADDEDDVELPSGWAVLGRGVGRLLTLTVGGHGLLSHFPVLLLGLVGAGSVVRRHWPRAVKTLAVVTLATLAVVVVAKTLRPGDAIDAGFAAPRLTVFAPAVLLLAGAWLRRPHGATVWTLAGVTLALSTAATVIGAAATPPPGGYSHYTLAEAVERLVRPTSRGE